MSDEVLLRASRFQVVRRTATAPDGEPCQREVILHPGAVTILPLFDDGRVCLVRNWRIAVECALLELPAGTAEPGEEPVVTARRELAEETGFQAARLRHLHSFWLSPGILHERMHLYLATGLKAGEMRLDPGERIEPLVVSWEEALAMASDGQIQDAKTLVGLLFYDKLCR